MAEHNGKIVVGETQANQIRMLVANLPDRSSPCSGYSNS